MDAHAARAPSSEGTATLIGVGLAVVASVLIAAGLNTQRLAHLKRSRRDGPSSSPLRGRPRPRSAHPHERTPLIVTTKPTLERSLSDPAPADRGRPQVQVVLPVVSESPPHSPPRTPTKRDRSTSRRRKPRLDKGFVRNPLWLLGFVLLNLGEFANFLAYGFAPPSVVAPLGLTTLVANVFLAPLIVREPFRRKDLLGVAVAILGGVTVVYASRSSDKKLTPDEFLAAISQPLFVSYAIVCCTCMSALAYLSRTKWGDRYVLVDLSLCALAGAFTVLSTKAISGFLNLYFLRMFRYWITWAVLVVLVSTALVQVNFVNKALQRFESRVVIPIQYITFALSTICGSALLYRDFEGVPAPSLLNFGFGTLISGAGAF
ncbi:hypothetical protein Rhopal_006903-T1 [Rhodotorula paludigena]|uniref:Magnesium transporter NIPA-domain-containing protein n=1 Tax=Rhodotorula paludigena TaxID=86838 RepID=A0AAV5GXF5_9BASI|nr:hypothetical protein Rhopal_006903-T1 [Rhodotorula paludigena]